MGRQNMILNYYSAMNVTKRLSFDTTQCMSRKTLSEIPPKTNWVVQAEGELASCPQH